MHSSPRILARLGRLAVVGILGARALSASLLAQGDSDTEQAFLRIKAATETTDYRSVQTRRVHGQFSGYGRGGEWVGAIESMLHRGARPGMVLERFAVELRGFEGVSLTPGELAQRQVLYQNGVGYLVRYQSFRVLDAREAARHYVVLAVGAGSARAGRACNRIAVICRTLDRPSWLVDLDAATALPLYCGEFTPEGRLVSELEVSHITYGSGAQIPAGDTWAWAPRMGVEEFPTAAQAIARASTITAMALSPTTDLGGRYLFDHARVVTDPVTGEQTLIHVFHDGLDALFVSQRARPARKDPGHTIRSYTEAGVHQCLFQQSSTEFLVVGRNATLKSIATRIYRRATSVL